MGFFDKLFGGDKTDKHFIPTSDLMPEDKFWSVIQTSYNNSDGDFEQQQNELGNELHKLPPQEIITFDNRFRQLRGNAYNWQLWAAIYIIHGGCSDDSFMDFRDWVIAQGKEFYNKTLADPGSLITVDQTKIEIDWEGIGYVPSMVFKKLTGQDIPVTFHENNQISGKEWSEDNDDLKNMFPALWEKYLNA